MSTDVKYTDTEQKLIDYMQGLNIIDCHEHLCSEQVRLNLPVDVFTLFSFYTQYDLYSSGIDRATYSGIDPWAWDTPVYDSLFDQGLSLEQRWKIFEPYWENIRYGSYARAAILTAKLFYDINEISNRTYRLLSERIKAENTNGLYDRVLSEKCNIRAVLNQSIEAGYNQERPLVPCMPGTEYTRIREPEQLEKISTQAAISVSSIDDLVEAVRWHIKKWAENGAVAFKIGSVKFMPPDKKQAENSLKELLKGHKLPGHFFDFEPLENFLIHNAIDMAAQEGMNITVHSGVWMDFRKVDCKNMLDIAPCHPQADFDLYHLGMPFYNDAIMVAKNLPNVYLNLCWSHIVSPVQTQQAIDVILDQVPVNKILAFGGDYGQCVEKVIGHLHIARENFACVFGRRIDNGLMDMANAKDVLRKWFWDNPLALYKKLDLE